MDSEYQAYQYYINTLALGTVLGKPWEVSSSVPVVTWCTTEDQLIPAAGYVLLQEYIPSGCYRTHHKEEILFVLPQ